MTGLTFRCRGAAAFLVTALVLPLGASAEPYRPPPAKEGFSYPECYCTNRDQRMEVGGFSCLTVDGERFLAQCDLSLNSPIWRKVEDSCPTAEVEGERSEKPAG